MTSTQAIQSETDRSAAIFILAMMAESRDPQTDSHLDRVQEYCRIIARHLATLPRFQPEVTDRFIELLYLISPLHDIGKVAIPADVLLKPGRLNDDEFEIMKTHTTLGARTLDAAMLAFPHAAFLPMAREIAATHHERYDGKGYPAGLQGDAIPLASRIIAVADVYDALTSKRVYKEAYPHSIARRMILAERGTRFDPDIVDAFLRNEPQILAVRDHYPRSRAA